MNIMAAAINQKFILGLQMEVRDIKNTFRGLWGNTPNIFHLHFFKNIFQHLAVKLSRHTALWPVGLALFSCIALLFFHQCRARRQMFVLLPLIHHLWFAAWQMVLHYIHPQSLQGYDRHWCCLPKQSKYWHWGFVVRGFSSNTSRRPSVNIFTSNKTLINWDHPPPPSKRLMPFVSACRWFY